MKWHQPTKNFEIERHCRGSWRRYRARKVVADLHHTSSPQQKWIGLCHDSENAYMYKRPVTKVALFLPSENWTIQLNCLCYLIMHTNFAIVRLMSWPVGCCDHLVFIELLMSSILSMILVGRRLLCCCCIPRHLGEGSTYTMPHSRSTLVHSV